MRYWTKIILLSYVPTLGIGLLLRQFWADNSETQTDLAIFSLWWTIVLLPVYLVAINFYVAKRHHAVQFIVNGLVMISCVLISAQINFYNWADSVGNRYNPDGGTEAIIDLERWIGSIICIIGTLVGHFQLTQLDKKSNADT